MIEQTILSYMGDVLDVPVLMELPEVPSEAYPQWPERFVVIEKIGLGKTDHVSRASVAFQTYSMNSLYEAACLDGEVREAVEQMIALPEIGAVRLQSNYNFTDARTKRYRYQCVYDFYFVE